MFMQWSEQKKFWMRRRCWKVCLMQSQRIVNVLNIIIVTFQIRSYTHTDVQIQVGNPALNTLPMDKLTYCITKGNWN